MHVVDKVLSDVDSALLVVVALVEADSADERVPERVEELSGEVVLCGVLVEEGERLEAVDGLGVGGTGDR